MPTAPLYLVESSLATAWPKSLGHRYLESHGQVLPAAIYPEMRVLTADKATTNRTFYPESSLRGDAEKGTGLASFVRPYPVPVIRDHLSHPGAMGGHASDVYGRVEKLPQFMKLDGEGYIRALPTITHPEAIEAVLAGRWMTISLGSRVESVHCSICGTDLTDPANECDHEKGQQYEVDGQDIEALWRIGPIRAKEISFVVQPSDDQAMVLNRNVTEGAASPKGGTPPLPAERVLSRILVGDSRGIFDLATGARVEAFVRQGRSTARPPRIHFLGFTPLKEHTMPNPQQPRLAEDFRGPGRYLLLGSDHDHEAILDEKGDGESSGAYWSGYAYNAPGDAASPFCHSEGDNYGDVEDKEDKSHVHLIVGGRVLHSGDSLHNHYIEPAHAGKESTAPPLSLGLLYQLPETDPDFATEATLTTQQRQDLKSSTFCGPNRSFPAPDEAHVTAGLRLLGRAKLSSEQKDRVRACLIRKGKAMGMTFDQESGAPAEGGGHAAKLVDAEHRVEIVLYPLPRDAEELEAVTQQAAAMPHSPAERQGIASRLAAAAKGFLAAADWQSRFGELPACEAGAPIEIALSSENYALLYAGLQHGLLTPAAEASCGACGDPTSDTGTPPVATGTPPVHTPAAAAPPEKTETAPPAEPPAEKPAEPPAAAPPVTEGAAPVTREGVPPALQEAIGRQIEQISALQDLAREALSHTVALYLRSMRKPQARNKTQAEVVAMLAGRTLESLRDTMADLAVEWEGAELSEIARLPQLADPTAPDTAGGLNDGRTAGTAEQQQLEGGAPAKLSTLEELPLEAGEPEVIRIQTDAFFAELFPNLQA